MHISRILNAAIGGLLIAGISSGANCQELLKARLAQNLSPISGITLVAKAQKLFEKHGLDISVTNFTSGKQCLDTVIGGGAEIATTAEAPVTAAAMAGQPIAFVAGMEYSDIKTLALRSAAIKSRADIKGKKIAFTAGTGSEVYTAQLLKSAGLTAKDVTLVNLKPQEMLPALASGSIDAFNTWEPHIANGKKAMGDQVNQLDTKNVYSETFNIVVMQAYLQANPKLIEKFLAALIDAEAWIAAHPNDAADLIAKAVGMASDDFRPLMSEYVYRVEIGPKQMDALKTHAAWRLETGNHPPGASMPDFSKFVFPKRCVRSTRLACWQIDERLPLDGATRDGNFEQHGPAWLRRKGSNRHCGG